MDMYKKTSIGTSVPIFNSANSQSESHSNGMTSSKSWSLFRWSKDNKMARRLEGEPGRRPSEEFLFTVPKDPSLSPYRASEELTKKLPPVKILVGALNDYYKDCLIT